MEVTSGSPEGHSGDEQRPAPWPVSVVLGATSDSAPSGPGASLSEPRGCPGDSIVVGTPEMDVNLCTFIGGWVCHFIRFSEPSVTLYPHP